MRVAGLIVSPNESNYSQLFFSSRGPPPPPPPRPLTLRSKQAAAVCTEEVLGVPALVQRCQDVLVEPARNRGVTSCFSQLVLRSDWPHAPGRWDMTLTRTVTHQVSHRSGRFTTGLMSLKETLEKRKPRYDFIGPDDASCGKRLHISVGLRPDL